MKRLTLKTDREIRTRVTPYLNSRHYDAYFALGGADWLRKKLDEAICLGQVPETQPKEQNTL